MGKKNVTTNYDGIIIIIIITCNRVRRMWNVKENVIPGITGATNYLRIIQAIAGQQSGKARNHGTTENSHIGNCTRTSEITNVKVQNIFNQRNNISTNCKYRTAGTLSTLETGLFHVYNCKYRA
jgi:hypothetical protein